jgi:predicted amidohydrolase
MKIAAYQAPLLSGGSMEVLTLIAEQVRACEAVGVEILCCPEAVLGGLADYSDRPADLALDVASGQLRSLLDPLSSTTVTTIVGFTESGPQRQLFNSAAIYAQGEVVGVYRKMHPAINRSVYQQGAVTPIFNVGGLIFGIVICRDSTYPELARNMVTRGAAALFVPTNNALAPTKGGAELVEYARRTDVSTAKANGMVVIRADVAGRVDGLESYGSSGIVGPDGTVLRVAKRMAPALLIADVQMRAVPTGRNLKMLANHRLQPTGG